ncbi:Uncharacterised protein [Actinomyces bovis]|uniref:Uncharacterized protein n=1 Tax=Actinomyces bovis TaxID=1658 RepID=A0ABY1VMK4_9ACTO|nr:Rv3235 family protein [Actinomyces bovis]SPT53339.1 Uncharacterised protein [Actinomyces bovis]VEG52702.1 Uncharacterised protein [Actinomyces israelii]
MTSLTSARPTKLLPACPGAPQQPGQKRLSAQSAKRNPTHRQLSAAEVRKQAAYRTASPQAPEIRVTVAPAAGARQARRVSRALPGTPTIPTPEQRASLTGGPVLTPGTMPRQDWDRVRFRARVDLPEAMSLVELAACPRSAAPTEAPEKAAEVLVRASLEVLSGRRSAQALVRHTTPELFEAIARRSSLAQRLRGRVAPATAPAIRSSRAQQPVPGRAEAVVLVETAGRVRAAAARLLLRRGRWILAGLEIA